MIFSDKKSIPDYPFVLNLNDTGTPCNPALIFPLERIKNSSPAPAFKILGVFIDEHLTFNFHVNCHVY